MSNLKISFLMAAHNEEKIISKSLDSLLKLPCEDYEVIIGLDGCTDRTLDIVKKYTQKSKRFKYKELNLRQGKPAVINSIIEMARGEVIVIQDADWVFKVKDANSLKKFLSVFDNQKVGGIAESFPVEWERSRLRRVNITYKMVAYSTFLWMKFQKEKLAVQKKDLLYIKNPHMFLTNIFRKKLYRQNISLGDDFERTQYIFKKGYNIVLFPQEEMPRMIATYNKINFKDFFKQKIRTAIARKQLKESDVMDVNIQEYYLPSVWFIFINSWKISFYIGALMSFWIFITSFATFLSKFKNIDTKKGWTLRAQR